MVIYCVFTCHDVCIDVGFELYGVRQHGLRTVIAKPSSTQKEWVLGMLTGINYQHQAEQLWPVDPLSKLGSAYQAFLWVDNYCKAHPLDTVGNAVVDLFDALWKK